MGTEKAFLRVGDELLLQRQLRCLRETGPAELLISGRIGVDYSCFGTRVVYDERSECGPLAGVAALLKASSCPFVLVLAVDMPAMTPAMLRKVLCGCGENSGCVPVDARGLQPLAAVYPAEALPIAERHLASGDASMRVFVAEAMYANLLRPLPIEAAETALFANWNRPDDWTPPTL